MRGFGAHLAHIWRGEGPPRGGFAPNPWPPKGGQDGIGAAQPATPSLGRSEAEIWRGIGAGLAQ